MFTAAAQWAGVAGLQLVAPALQVQTGLFLLTLLFL